MFDVLPFKILSLFLVIDLGRFRRVGISMLLRDTVSLLSPAPCSIVLHFVCTVSMVRSTLKKQHPQPEI
jgi:hypothetical protein